MNNPDSTTSISDLKRQRTEPKSYTFGRRYERNRTKRTRQEINPDEETKQEEGISNVLNIIL